MAPIRNCRTPSDTRLDTPPQSKNNTQLKGLSPNKDPIDTAKRQAQPSIIRDSDVLPPLLSRSLTERSSTLSHVTWSCLPTSLARIVAVDSCQTSIGRTKDLQIPHRSSHTTARHFTGSSRRFASGGVEPFSGRLHQRVSQLSAQHTVTAGPPPIALAPERARKTRFSASPDKSNA